MKKFTAEQIKRLLAEMQFQERIKKIDMGECSPLTAENGTNPFALAYQNPGQSVGCVLQTADGPIPGSVEWNAKPKVRKPSLFEQQAQRDADVRLAAAAEGSDDRDEYVGSSDGLSEPSRLTEEGTFSFSVVDSHEALDLRFSVPASTDQPIAIVHASGKVEIPDKGCDGAITNLNASVECRARKRKRASHRQATEADGTPSTESDQQASEWEKRCLSESELTYFFKRYLRVLQRYACYCARVRNILEDCGSEGLSKAIEELIVRREEKLFEVPMKATEEQVCVKIKPAIYGLIRQRIVDVHRKRRPTQSLDQALNDAEQEGASLGSTIPDESLASRSPIELRVDKEMIEALNQAIEHLNEKEQVAIRLRSQEDFSYDEIAEAMGESLTNVKTLLLRARLQLRTVLSEAVHK